MKTIAVTSGKGGTGKSCVAAYVGAALAKLNKQVLIIEMGSSTRSMDLVLGTVKDISLDFSQVLARNIVIEKAILQSSYNENLYLLPSATISSNVAPTHDWLQLTLESLNDKFDIVILDGIDFPTFPMALVDTVLLTTTPDSLAVRASAVHARTLFAAGANEVRLVINRVSSQTIPMYGARDFDDVIDTIGARLIAVVPASPILQYCSNNAQMLEEDTLPSQVFDALAQRILGKNLVLLVK